MTKRLLPTTAYMDRSSSLRRKHCPARRRSCGSSAFLRHESGEAGTSACSPRSRPTTCPASTTKKPVIWVTARVWPVWGCTGRDRPVDGPRTKSVCGDGARGCQVSSLPLQGSRNEMTALTSCSCTNCFFFGCRTPSNQSSHRPQLGGDGI